MSKDKAYILVFAKALIQDHVDIVIFVHFGSIVSGVYAVFGVSFPIVKETRFHKLLFSGFEEKKFGKRGFTVYCSVI